MAYAAILSLEEFRDTPRRAEMRQRLHDGMEQWLDTLEERVKDPQPTLEELTQAVFALRQELTQAVTEGLGEQAHRAAMEQRTAACPQGGQMLSARGPQDRTVETLGERSDSGARTFTVSTASSAPPRWTRRCS